jgi:hypothetical protein
MGLDDLLDDDVTTGEASASQFRRYGSHKADEQLNEWYEEFQERFPERVELDFIEVSPQLENTSARFYKKDREEKQFMYVRISEKTLERDEWWQRNVLLNQMVIAYCHQRGYHDISTGSSLFKWLCGRVGCAISQVNIDSMEWQDLAEPLMDPSMVDGDFTPEQSLED